LIIQSKDRKLVTVVWLVGIVAIWELVAFLLQYILHDPLAATKLPFPHVILITFIQNGFMLLGAGVVTFSRAAFGFALGAGVGFVLAIIMSLSKTVERIAFPYLIISQMIPVLGLAPIIFNIVRDMDTSRIVIAAYITFFPVSVNMLSGLKSVEQDKKELLYSIAANNYKIYRKLMLPFSMPYLFTGLKIAAPMAVTASILVDMLGSSSGIGVKLLYSLYSGSTDIFWASVITSAIMGILSYYMVVTAEKILIPWQNVSTKKRKKAVIVNEE
jgi:NitT/TauT family transport system permease protein